MQYNETEETNIENDDVIQIENQQDDCCAVPSAGCCSTEHAKEDTNKKRSLLDRLLGR